VSVIQVASLYLLLLVVHCNDTS